MLGHTSIKHVQNDEQLSLVALKYKGYKLKAVAFYYFIIISFFRQPNYRQWQPLNKNLKCNCKKGTSLNTIP